MTILEPDDRQALKRAVRDAVYNELSDAALLRAARALGVGPQRPSLPREARFARTNGDLDLHLDGVPLGYALDETRKPIVLVPTNPEDPVTVVTLHLMVVGEVYNGDRPASAIVGADA